MYFIDCETVPAYRSFELAPKNVQDLYEKKFSHNLKEYEMPEFDNLDEHYKSKAGLYAEFGKIVCVCIGRIKDNELHIRTLCSRHENIILEKLAQILTAGGEKVVPLCAHNGKEFDYPFLMRRYLINKLHVPKVLNTLGLKPWETQLHDTMEMWSGTQWKYRASLDLLCNVLGIESPKHGDVTGSNLAEVYYSMFDEQDELPFDKETEVLDKIGGYCANDIEALARVYCALNGTPGPEQVVYLENK
jgi:uncharacterized protein YprB with RNaseH-like and TPR domain